MTINFNKKECEKYYDLKYKDGDIVEIRAIDKTKKNPPVERFVKNKEQFVKVCEELNAIENLQVYAGHNPRTTEGRDALSVKSVSHICLDCDPVRAKGFEKKAATQEEVDLCEIEVDKIIDSCPKINLNKPTKIFTGNGFALDWKIPTIEITDENRKEVESKIQAFTKQMQGDFNCNNMIIDQTGDLPRIYKPTGVMSKKGDGTEDRPFRLSKFITSSDIEECEKLKEHILKIDITVKDDFEFKQNSSGKDGSRSATEYREILKQIRAGKTKDDVYKYMIAFSKWTSSVEAYREHTYNKALAYVNKQDQKKKKPIENIQNNKDYSDLQKEVLTNIALKNYDRTSELIVKEVKENNFIYTTKNDVKSEMWIYEEGIYKPNGKTYIKEFSRSILGETYNNYIANLVISKIETDTYIKEEDFFINNHVDELPVENGILNVITRELLDFDPEKIFFNKLPVEYNEDATCKSIDTFLRDILTKEEDIIVAYEIVGSGLMKEYFTEKAAMLVGGGRNGKSKFLELIKKLAGIDNTCSVPIRSMKEDNSSLCELHGRLFNLAGDLSGGDLKETGVFKQTVGRDTLQAHRKFLTDLKFVNYAKHIFACNELPKVYDTTDGFWEKWVLLKFPYKFITQEEIDKLPEIERKNKKIKDQYIIDKISTPEELSGFLNKALDGLDSLLKNNNFSQTVGSKEIKDYWIRNSDSFAAFCIDNLEESYNSCIPKKQIRSMFSRYCKTHQIKGAGDKSIKATLEDRYGAFDNRKMYNDEITPVWEGIKFIQL